MKKPKILQVRAAGVIKEIDRMRKDYAFDSSINGIAFTDLKDKINYMNKSFLEMWGFANENEIGGKSFVKLWENEQKTTKDLDDLYPKIHDIVNELIPADNFYIVIELYPEDADSMVLRVMDNGIGLPEDVDFFKTPSLGLRLVRLLTKQIHGTIHLNQICGTDVKIRFKVKIN